jgi:hypothetical protein
LHTSIPNAKPEHVSSRLHQLIGSNKLMQCIFYGVQDMAEDKSTQAVITTATEVVAQTMKQAAKTVVVEVRPAQLIPNPRPSTTTPGLARILDRYPLLQCVFYGVQETATGKIALNTSSKPEHGNPSLIPVHQRVSDSAAELRSPKQSRAIFKDLDIATAAVSLGGTKCANEVPTWY